MIKQPVSKVNLFLFGILLILVLPIAACWDRMEIEERGFVLGMGLDLIREGGDRWYEVTSQIAVPSQGMGGQAGGGGGGGGEMAPSWNVTTRSRDSLTAALGQDITRADKTPSFTHMRVLVIGEEMARSGLNQVMDFFMRTRDIRLRVKVLLAEGKAKKVLDVKPRISTINALYLNRLTENNKQNFAMATQMDLGKLMRSIHEDVPFILPRVKAGQDDVEISGAGLFKKSRMVGWIDKPTVEGIQWVTNQVFGGQLVARTFQVAQIKPTFQITGAKSKVHPRYDQGLITFHVDIKVEGILTEKGTSGHVFNSRYLAQVEQLLAEEIEHTVKNSVTVMQQQYSADVFGFGTHLERRYPGLWREIGDRWEDVFPTVDVLVHARVQIRRVGTSK